jgi:hypothetical protein
MGRRRVSKVDATQSIPRFRPALRAPTPVRFAAAAFSARFRGFTDKTRTADRLERSERDELS